jgi:hypothetical protein
LHTLGAMGPDNAAPASAPAGIDDGLLALMHGRVSILVASRDADHRPHVMRAIGCRVRNDRRRVTVMLCSRTSAPVLADLRANGAIAVVFSEPSTHRSVQLKGDEGAGSAVALCWMSVSCMMFLVVVGGLAASSTVVDACVR